MNVRLLALFPALAIVVACSSERDRNVGTPTPPERFVVGSSGGTFTTSDGVGIEVPAGALTATITITVSKTTLPPGNALTPVSSVYEFKPAGTEFAVPVTLRIPYIGGTAQPIGFYYTGENEPTILSLIPSAAVANGVGTAMVDHFSIGCVAYPSDGTARDAGVLETTDGGNPGRDAGTAPRDGGVPRDAGQPGGCGCEPGPKCESCCEVQQVCGYTECIETDCPA